MNEALRKAYTESEELEIIRINFLNQMHLKHFSYSRFLPDIRFSYSQPWQIDFDADKKFKELNDASWQIQATQNLFNKGIDLIDVKSKRFTSQKALFEYQNFEQDILFKMISAYIENIHAHKILKISENNLQVYKTKLEYVKAKYIHGEATSVELEISKASLARAEKERHSAVRHLKDSESKFFLYLRFLPDNLELTNFELKSLENVNELSSQILKNNFQVKLALRETYIAKSELYKARASFLPQVDLKLSRSNETYFSAKSKLEIRLDVPILNQGGKDLIQIRVAHKDYLIKKAQYLKIFQEISDRIKFSLEEFNNLIEQIKANDKAITSSKIAHEAMNQEYLIGTRTLVDVLNEQEKLNQFLIEDINLRKNLALSFYKIKILDGKLLMKEIDQENKSQYFDPNRHI
ncbi:MAG: TolC family protein [Rickettsia sp.]|nr:TolC family protein [Rickettsia sp.]